MFLITISYAAMVQVGRILRSLIIGSYVLMVPIGSRIKYLITIS